MSELTDKVFNMVQRGEAAEAIRFTKRCSDSEKAEILLASQNIWYLARNGQAKAVVEIIGTLPPPVQEKILSNLFVIEDLAHAGEGGALIVLINKQPLSARQNILNTKRAKCGLQNAGFGKEIGILLAGGNVVFEAFRPAQKPPQPRTSTPDDR